MSRGAVFLDRDGTIVRPVVDGTTVRPCNLAEEIELYPGVVSGMQLLEEADLPVILVTNQGGIGHGYMTEAELDKMNARINAMFLEKQVRGIGHFYHCPHRLDARCECRKPRPGMLLSAIEDLGIDPMRSYMVGDDPRDMEAAVCAGIHRKYMVLSDLSRDTPLADAVFPTFLAAAITIADTEKLGADNNAASKG